VAKRQEGVLDPLRTVQYLAWLPLCASAVSVTVPLGVNGVLTPVVSKFWVTLVTSANCVAALDAGINSAIEQSAQAKSRTELDAFNALGRISGLSLYKSYRKAYARKRTPAVTFVRSIFSCVKHQELDARSVAVSPFRSEGPSPWTNRRIAEGELSP